MSWTRLDDNWADKIRTMDLDFQTRWHYLSLIQFCSRTNKRDGRLKAADARSCSDVDDPIGCLNELIEHNLVTRDVTRDGDRDVTYYTILAIRDHLPSDNKLAQKNRQARHRAHKVGDHSMCLPENCPESAVTADERDVTRDTGTVTGQDGPGREELQGYVPEQRTSTEPSTPPPPGGVDLTTGVLSEPGPYKPCTECGSTSGTCPCFDEPEVGTCGWCGPDSVCDCPGGPGPRPPALARQ